MRLIRRDRSRTLRLMMEQLEPRQMASATPLEKLPVMERLHRHAPPHVRDAAVTNAPANAPTARGGQIPGDCNNDGTVDLADFSIWCSAIGSSAAGDMNNDGFTDLGDFNIWFTHVGTTAATVPPPPPAPSYDWHTQTISGVLNVWAPNPTDFGTTVHITDTSALFGSDGIPNINSVYQSGAADCYFLATIGSVANAQPAKIQTLVNNDTAGGWTVTYYWFNPNTGVTSPVVVHTSNELAAASLSSGNGEVWSKVMEKAYAAFRTWNGATSTNTMASIGWGYAGTVMQHLGMSYSTAGYAAGVDAAYNTLSNNLSAHRPMEFHTSSTATTMVASHVYAITGVHTDASGVKWVTTYNPWGFFEDRQVADMLPNGIGYLVVGPP